MARPQTSCSKSSPKNQLAFFPGSKKLLHFGQLRAKCYIQVPDEVARKIVDSLHADSRQCESQRQERLKALSQKLATVRSRMDQIYDDKLDGRTDEEFWSRKQAALRAQELTLETQLSSCYAVTKQENVLTIERVFELANKAYSLYVTRNAMERGRLLKMLLLNCATDGATLWPVYRKPFDLIFERAKTEDWSGREDLNL